MNARGKVRRRGLLPLAVLALGMLLTACTGVPSSSTPEVVQTIGAQQSTEPAVSTPHPGTEPRNIVNEFLQNNAVPDAAHLAAKAYLTAAAKATWSDTSVTIISNPLPSIGYPDAKGQVTGTITGDLIGTIDPNGIYTPQQVVGTGTPQQQVTRSFTLKQVNGQWRIDKLTNGLLITDQDFRAFYQQQVLYFFDQAEQHVVQDPRYTALQDPNLLANWLMTQLVNVATSEPSAPFRSELPTQTDPRLVIATQGPVFKIEIPGSSQLPAQTKNLLAEQVALTLQKVPNIGSLSITDGGRPVQIPTFGSAVFTAGSFSNATDPEVTAQRLFYLDQQGRVVDNATGKVVPGPLGSAYQFASIGLASHSSTVSDSRLLVAGVDGQNLYVGTSSGLHQVAGVSGTLTRPAWAPFRDEVWVASGAKLYRVSSSATLASPVQISVGAGGTTISNIEAVRISPDGARVALVLQTAPGGPGQIWLGWVVRPSNNTSVQVSGLKLISPTGAAITDVAWNDGLNLFAVGHDVGGSPNVYELKTDGSLWTPHGISTLPAGPDTITVAENEVAAVSVAGTASAAGTVWQQNVGFGSWVGLGPSENQTRGSSPVYVE